MNRQDHLASLLRDALLGQKASIARQWSSPAGTATRHFVVDDLLPPDICRAIHDAFPRDGAGFFGRDTFREKKKTSADLGAYAPILSDITYAFQDKTVVGLVAELVGFEAIEPDPKLYAGGLSMMVRGDFLNPHIDNSHDLERARYRRLNLLYYVSPDWTAEDGGHFELWDARRAKPKTIEARTNRLIVMETTKTSWHSVSRVAADRPRCCVSNYYFSTISPDRTDYFHVTSFTGRPEERLKRALGLADNALRGIASRVLKRGRGRNLINKTKT